MQNHHKSLYILNIIILFFATVAEAKKCKTFDNLKIKRALTVCGAINGAKMGQLLAYGSFINNDPAPAVVNTGDDIPFTADTVTPSNISHAPGSFTNFTIQQSGIYSLFYKVRTNVFVFLTTQLFNNGNPVTGTDDSGITATIDGVFFTANAGDVITLRNTGVPFTPASFGSAPPVSLTLIRIA